MMIMLMMMMGETNKGDPLKCLFLQYIRFSFHLLCASVFVLECRCECVSLWYSDHKQPFFILSYIRKEVCTKSKYREQKSYLSNLPPKDNLSCPSGGWDAYTWETQEPDWGTLILFLHSCSHLPGWFCLVRLEGRLLLTPGRP